LWYYSLDSLSGLAEGVHNTDTVWHYVLLQVPQQYPPEVREVLIRSRNSAVLYDYSQPDYEDLKKRRQRWGAGAGWW
jgi:hypothetical protein